MEPDTLAKEVTLSLAMKDAPSDIDFEAWARVYFFFADAIDGETARLPVDLALAELDAGPGDVL